MGREWVGNEWEWAGMGGHGREWTRRCGHVGVREGRPCRSDGTALASESKSVLVCVSTTLQGSCSALMPGALHTPRPASRGLDGGWKAHSTTHVKKSMPRPGARAGRASSLEPLVTPGFVWWGGLRLKFELA